MTLIGETRNLTGWDRDVYLTTYYNMACNYAVNTYGRGRCAIKDHSDLEAVAIDALFSTADTFPGWCEKNNREPSGALFWTVLCRSIQQRMRDEIEKIQRRAYLSTDERFGADEDISHPLLTAHELTRYRAPSMLLSEIVDFMAVFPTRWKLLLALRYHAEMPFQEIAEVMGMGLNPVRYQVAHFTKLIRAFALSRVAEDAVEVDEITSSPWEIPATAHRWVWRNTDHIDVHSYLGRVQRDYAADSTYVAEMLNRANGVRTSPAQRGARPERITALCGTYRAWQRHRRAEETPCDECERAKDEFNAARRAA